MARAPTPERYYFGVIGLSDDGAGRDRLADPRVGVKTVLTPALQELRLDSAAAVSGRGSQGPAGAGGLKILFALGSVAVRMASVWSHKRVSDFLKNVGRIADREGGYVDTENATPLGTTHPHLPVQVLVSRSVPNLPLPNSRPFLTVEEAAAVLGISRTLLTASPTSS